MVQRNAKSSTGLDENVAASLSYLLGFITGFVFYWEEKESDLVRFHALQSIITFIPVWIVLLVLEWIPLIGTLAWILALMLWVLLMIRAYSGRAYRLPFVGAIAEDVVRRSAEKKAHGGDQEP
ncbi:MAG: DUF4870 domain-containing protein [Deltaproteobacteria bacterium]|nr:DUF4870 domain-containing protein [Deltaproteobacteria bacterium]